MVGLILRNWQLVVIGLLLAALSGTGYYIKLLNSQKDTLVAEKNLIQAALDVSQGSVKSLTEAVAEQNTAIGKFKDAAEKSAKESAIAIAKAKADAAKFKKRADDLLTIRPDPDKPICESADDLFNREIQNAK